MKVQDDRNTLLLIGLCFVKKEVHPEGRAGCNLVMDKMQKGKIKINNSKYLQWFW